jgi:hypothetical protein
MSKLSHFSFIIFSSYSLFSPTFQHTPSPYVRSSRYSDCLRAVRLRGSRFESRGSRILDFSISSRQALGSPSLISNGYPGALSPGAKGGKGVLLTAHTKYLQRSKNVDLYNRIPNTSIVASCLIKLSMRAFFTSLHPYVSALLRTKLL